MFLIIYLNKQTAEPKCLEISSNNDYSSKSFLQSIISSVIMTLQKKTPHKRHFKFGIFQANLIRTQQYKSEVN